MLPRLLVAGWVLAVAAGCSATHGQCSDADVADAESRRPRPVDDADEDFIPDLVEGWPDRDWDGDGQPDYRDTDADAMYDRVEAGDTHLTTPPANSDGDGFWPDYVTPRRDSNSDGLPDYLDPEI